MNKFNSLHELFLSELQALTYFGNDVSSNNSNQTELKIGDRILIKAFKNQADGTDMRPYNGIWEVLHTGSAINPTDHDGDGDIWDHPDYYAFPILQRTLDFNSGSEVSSAAVYNRLIV